MQKMTTFFEAMANLNAALTRAGADNNDTTSPESEIEDELIKPIDTLYVVYDGITYACEVHKTDFEMNIRMELKRKYNIEADYTEQLHFYKTVECENQLFTKKETIEEMELVDKDTIFAKMDKIPREFSSAERRRRMRKRNA